MKTLITVYTQRKLGGRQYRQVLIDDTVAVSTIDKMLELNKIRTLSNNHYEDRSGRNFSGYMFVHMLVSAGGEVVERGIE